jgi:NADPH-dependent curcumin reductase CurA
MSVDPYLRYSVNFCQPGEPLVGFVTGVVRESNNPNWSRGDFFSGKLPLSTFQNVQDCSTLHNLTGCIDESELSLGLGLLGMPGSTAYAALDLMNVQPSDRVWISDCCGAVGHIAGQIAKNVRKCQLVIGSCGHEQKCQIAQQRLGFDKAFDYNVSNLAETVRQQAPEGLDFYLEMVGGKHLTAAVENMRPFGRIAIAGAISGYNEQVQQDKLRLDVVINEMTVLFHQVRIQGFQCFEWLEGRRGNFLEDMTQWYRQGLVSREESVFEGIEKWPAAFKMLFEKGNEDHVGKVVVKI